MGENECESRSGDELRGDNVSNERERQEGWLAGWLVGEEEYSISAVG